jgi:mono/diheme cytochrome c family protein
MAALFLAACASAGEPVIINETAVPPLPTLSPDRVAQGEQLYTQHCAGCHGANLEGAPDWKKPLDDGSLLPPPHDSSGHTWHHTDSLLITIIAKGGQAVYDNAKMPAFGDKLAEDEVAAVLDFIKSKWGKDEREFQWWVTYTRGE